MSELELDGGDQLVAVRQNLETAAAGALEARGSSSGYRVGVAVFLSTDTAYRPGRAASAAPNAIRVAALRPGFVYFRSPPGSGCPRSTG